METKQQDALLDLTRPNPSPSLTVLREAVGNGETFTLKHQPMACPEVPELSKRVPAGRRSHEIETLTDLKQYVDHLRIGDESKSIGFYNPDGVSVVLDESSPDEKEVVTCSLARHYRFSAWEAVFGEPMSQLAVLNLLREHGDAVTSDGGAAALINAYSALSGTLVHDAEEYLSQQSGSVSFTVSRKSRGAEKQAEIDDVPTEFTIAVPVLADDEEATTINVLVRMSGAAGAQICFELTGQNLAEHVDAHIEQRLKAFADDAGFLCLRGRYMERDWTEPKLPESVRQLMSAQTEMIRAMAASDR